MTQLSQILEEKMGSLKEAYGALAGCHSAQALREALRTHEPLVTAAERFATSIAHVETAEARQFRDAVRTVRRALGDRKETLQGVALPVEVTFVPSHTPKKSEPPADALVLSRLEAHDNRKYMAAKERA